MSHVVTRSRAKAQDLKVLDDKAAAGETLIPGGTGGRTLDAQEGLAAGRKAGRQAHHQTEEEAETAKKADHTKHKAGDHGTKQTSK